MPEPSTGGAAGRFYPAYRLAYFDQYAITSELRTLRSKDGLTAPLIEAVVLAVQPRYPEGRLPCTS